MRRRRTSRSALERVVPVMGGSLLGSRGWRHACILDGNPARAFWAKSREGLAGFGLTGYIACLRANNQPFRSSANPQMSLRPAILDPYFAPATSVPGVGPKIAPLIDRLGRCPGPAGADRGSTLSHSTPAGIDRRLRGSIAEAPVGEQVTLAVHRSRSPAGPAQPLESPVSRRRRGCDRRYRPDLLQPAPPAHPGPVAGGRAKDHLRQDRIYGTGGARWCIPIASSMPARPKSCPASNPSTARPRA